MMNYRLVHVACAVGIDDYWLPITQHGSSEIHTYRLSLDGWLATPVPASEGPVLLVSQPQAEPGFETQRMVYVKRPYELEYYAVNQWADTPVRMFAPLMVQALNQTEVWGAVIPLPSTIRGDYRLDTHGFLYGRSFSSNRVMRVMIRAQLVDGKTTVPELADFEVVENATSENPYGGVQAANRAVAVLLNQIDSWLRQCVQHSPECSR